MSLTGNPIGAFSGRDGPNLNLAVFRGAALALGMARFRTAGFRTKTTTTKNGTRVTRVTDKLKEWPIQAAAVRALRALPEFAPDAEDVLAGRGKFTLAGDMAAGKRGWQNATIAKATGLVSGEHDIRVFMIGGLLGLIEMKAGTKVSKKQEARHALLFALGFTRQAVVDAATEADAASQVVSIVLGWLAANDNQKDGTT